MRKAWLIHMIFFFTRKTELVSEFLSNQFCLHGVLLFL